MAFTRVQKTRIDVFDAYTEAKTGQAKKVAEVSTDGKRGQVQVLDPAFAGVLKDAFERPQHVFGHGVTANGLSMDGAPRVLPAWSDEAIQHVVKNELKVHQLRAEIAKAK
ncbi:MAG: hypothetical protein KC933_13625 [Myxococcales bacterium]|nr:hypothetical protein [Myxococcales bacterium]